MLKKIYENKSIEVGTTGRDYDQIGYIKNKTNNKIRIEFGEVPGYIDEDGDEYEAEPEPVEIEPHDVVGLLADFNGWGAIMAIKNGTWQYYVTDKIMQTPYERGKTETRDEAINWQMDFSEKDYSYSELADWATYFEKKGRRYGLLKEFRENGIC